MGGKRALVGIEIHRLDNRITRILENQVKEAGFDEVTLMHGWIIHYLYVNRERDVYQRDIEKHCCVGRSTVTSVIQLMERKGLIRRESVENDARLKKVLLTDKGYRHREVVEGTIEALNKQMLRDVSEEEYDTFLRVLHKLQDNLDIKAKSKASKED